MNFCFALCFLTFTQAGYLPLLQLKAFWTGNGVSYFVPGRLQLLSHKLTAQSGLVTGQLPLPGGNEWQLRLTLSLDCRNSTETALAVFLTKRSTLQFNSRYNAETHKETFGMATDISGLGAIFHRGNIYSAYYNQTVTNREQLLRKSQIAKGLFDPEKHELHLAVKRWSRTVAVYQVDAKTGVETSCATFEDLLSLESFYLTVTAYDNGGSCRAQATDATLSTEARIDLASPATKTRADTKLALYDKDTLVGDDLQHFFKTGELVRQNAKIMAAELLSFADKDEKTVVGDLVEEYRGFKKDVRTAASVVEKEAQQLSTFVAALASQKEGHSASKEVSLKKLLEHLEGLEKSFRAVDDYTMTIYRGIKRLELFDHLWEISYQAENLSDELGMLLSRTKKVMEKARKARGEAGGLNSVKERLDAFAKKVANDLEENSRKRSSSFWKLFGSVAGMVLCLVTVVYGFLYFKLQKASQAKRIL